MPPATKKNVSVILFDLKMDKKKSLGILDKIILHMSIVNPKDVTRLILLNSTESRNLRNFRHIYEVTTEVPYTYDLQNCIEDAEIDDCNWLEGLELAANVLDAYSGNKAIFTKQLIMISDLNYPPLDEDALKQATKINSILTESEIFLYIIGPETVPGITVRTKEDIRCNMENVEFINGGCKEGIQAVTAGADAIICGSDLAIDYLSFYKNKIPKQAWLVPLTIEDFEFPTITTRLVNKVEYPKTTKREPPVYKWKVKSDDIDVGEVEYDYGDLVKVYSFMDKIITLPDDVKESFKFKGNRMFRLVGFVDSTDIPELFLGSEEIYHVQINPEESKAPAFYHLLKATHDRKKYALALRAYNNNNVPKLYVLIPKPEEHRFIMVPHPGLIVDGCRRDFVKHNSADCNEKILNDFSDFVCDLAKQPLTLHPTASVGVYHKQYLENVVRLVKKTGEEVKVKVEGVDLKDKESFKRVQVWIGAAGEVNAGEVAKEETKIVEDDDDDW